MGISIPRFEYGLTLSTILNAPTPMPLPSHFSYSDIRKRALRATAYDVRYQFRCELQKSTHMSSIACLINNKAVLVRYSLVRYQYCLCELQYWYAAEETSPIMHIVRQTTRAGRHFSAGRTVPVQLALPSDRGKPTSWRVSQHTTARK